MGWPSVGWNRVRTDDSRARAETSISLFKLPGVRGGGHSGCWESGGSAEAIDTASEALHEHEGYVAVRCNFWLI